MFLPGLSGIKVDILVKLKASTGAEYPLEASSHMFNVEEYSWILY
ncbi:MAG: hypothetical protein RR539_04450 [Clostridium sp.]